MSRRFTLRIPLSLRFPYVRGDESVPAQSGAFSFRFPYVRGDESQTITSSEVGEAFSLRAWG